MQSFRVFLAAHRQLPVPGSPTLELLGFRRRSAGLGLAARWAVHSSAVRS